MRTIRTKLYKFNELSTEAKQKAITWYESILSKDQDILFGFKEYCEEQAEELGFEDVKVQYSLSSSQGDGLSFSASLDVEKFLKDQNIRPLFRKVLANYLTVKITGNKGRYCFASKSDIDIDIDGSRYKYQNIENYLLTGLRETLETMYLDLCRKLEETGYNWITDRYKEENIIQDIEANEYEFLKDGTKY